MQMAPRHSTHILGCRYGGIVDIEWLSGHRIGAAVHHHQVVGTIAVGVYGYKHVGGPVGGLFTDCNEDAVVLGTVLRARHHHIGTGGFEQALQFQSAPQVVLRFPAAFFAYRRKWYGGIPTVGGV